MWWGSYKPPATRRRLGEGGLGLREGGRQHTHTHTKTLTQAGTSVDPEVLDYFGVTSAGYSYFGTPFLQVFDRRLTAGLTTV